jgi:predicted enzyme related to lactoylglutathione lyase
MARATGIGGVFFRSADPEATLAWYVEHLGLEPEEGFPCAIVNWTGGESTVWAPFTIDSDYFGDGEQPMMVNYRVDDLVGMIDQLKAAGVTVLDKRESDENGDFAWAVDCDGRRFELWQPAPGR